MFPILSQHIDCRLGQILTILQTFWLGKLLGNKLAKGPTGLLGRSPQKGFDVRGVSILLDADALVGIAMPAGASAFNSLETMLNTDARSNADALAGIAMPARASVSNSMIH